MRDSTPCCPLPIESTIDMYFMEHRAKLLDVAAFLDRLDRCAGKSAETDFRLRALNQAIAVLGDGKPGRTSRILTLLSDPTVDLIASAAGMKGATGAWPGRDGDAEVTV